MNSAYSNDGGEMGELIQKYNWTSTPLGAMNDWPPSLLTTLGIILHSKFPMLLYWGTENTCFYNDAFRPSLGYDGKHPAALGKKGEDVWPEIWSKIHPIIGLVLEGKGATYSEDQLLPIFRNGKLENVYWTFSYSPVMAENRIIGGVFVTCTETTDRVISLNSIRTSEKRFQNLIREATLGIAVLTGPGMLVEIANDSFTRIFNRSFKELRGRPFFETIPEARSRFAKLCIDVLKTSEPIKLYNQLYHFPTAARVNEVYLNIIIQPYREDDGSITGVMMLCQDVTDQMMDQLKAEDSEHHFHNLVAEASVATAVFTGVDMKLEEANEAILHIWGKTTQVIGMPITEFLPEIEGQVFRMHLDEVFRSGTLYSVQDLPILLYRESRWETVHMDFSYMALRNAKRKITGVLVMGTDVTARVKGQRRLEQSEETLKRIILQCPVAICIFKGEDNVVDIVNTRMLELWGKNSLQVLNKPLLAGVPELKGQGIADILNTVYKTGQVMMATGVPITLTRNGVSELTYVNYLYEAFIDVAGQISGVIAIANDVTEQVLATRRIEQSEERGRRAINSAELGIYEIDIETNAFVCDARVYEILGADHSISIDDLYSVIFKEDFKASAEATQKSFKSEVLDYKARIVKPDQSVHWVRNKGTILFNSDGNAFKIIGVLQDITDQVAFADNLEINVRQRTRELADANQLLQQSNVELNQFVYVASHDLQEPLRKVVTYMGYLQSGLLNASPDTLDYIAKIKTSTSRMRVLIDDVLRFSQLSNERENFMTTDLNLVMADVLKDYELLISQKHGELIVDKLPVIESIPLQMTQLFTNLISNALKFSSKNRDFRMCIKASILTIEQTDSFPDLSSDGTYWRISFEDNGIGFSAQYKTQIFNIFQRLHNKSKYEGTGIGLALCKKIVLNHGGLVYAEPNETEGATFYIVLPECQVSKTLASPMV